MTGTLPLFSQAHEAIAALRRDLIDPEDGPRISTMRNYRFAIVQYSPEHEYAMRAEVQRLVSELEARRWFVLTIDLQKLLLARIRSQPDDWQEKVIAMESRMAERQLDRGLNYLKSKLLPLVEGPEGLAGDCRRLIQDFVQKHPDKADQTLVLIGRAGGLYPFFRSSALLRHLDGQTGNVPVVLLYPGTKQGPTSLSFMGVLSPDSDYRPRIYP
ncbi:DUF1788 domain-containing protein [Vulcanococcus limneticus]|uniref:DUF1788 domain-containing protein n=1 Tax=Vulcanococcus limneticus TaxID=2170428 RepID=UPI00398C0163